MVTDSSIMLEWLIKATSILLVTTKLKIEIK
ncbi:hypothetical protein CPS_1320 [Colwellia psychrerythraea 34H]|uniref:Uncharacterized protein n=1 Tax=Colwellia psychrerythraea (strain 34H / ATCC BAA-681) TaxID=167879 RepID=Q486F2_COLP3|nr:hypothetical protein CPS_1320 [Colwellia psychrerythraea 34H]